MGNLAADETNPGVLIVVITGCTTRLVVDTDISEPLGEPLPVTMGLYYQDRFMNHSYEEDTEDRPH